MTDLSQAVALAIAPEGVRDIVAAAGLQQPDIASRSEAFLAEMREMAQKNVAVARLRKLLAGALRTRRRTHIVQARCFAELLAQAIRTGRSRWPR